MAKIILYIIVFAAGFILISMWNFYRVVDPPRTTTSLIPKDFNLPSETVTIIGADNVRLSGWFVESPVAYNKKSIIILHGYPADKSDMLSIAASLYPDFSLLLLDLRSFGESEGAYTTFGVKERADINAVIDFLEQKGKTNVGTFGFSLGGAIGIMSAAEEARIKAVASYGAFSDLRSLGYDTYSKLFMLKYPMTELMLLYARLLFGESLAVISPRNAATKLTIPIFLAHDRGDEQISFSHAKRLGSALSANKKTMFYTIEGGAHGELPSDFYIQLKNFFKESL